MGPDRVETCVLFLCGGLVGPVARSAWIYSVLCPDRLTGAENLDLAGLNSRSGGSDRKLKPTGPYAARIAAISGPMPIMFITRLRL